MVDVWRRSGSSTACWLPNGSIEKRTIMHTGDEPNYPCHHVTSQLCHYQFWITCPRKITWEPLKKSARKIYKISLWFDSLSREISNFLLIMSNWIFNFKSVKKECKLSRNSIHFKANDVRKVLQNADFSQVSREVRGELRGEKNRTSSQVSFP